MAQYRLTILEFWALTTKIRFMDNSCRLPPLPPPRLETSYSIHVQQDFKIGFVFHGKAIDLIRGNLSCSTDHHSSKYQKVELKGTTSNIKSSNHSKVYETRNARITMGGSDYSESSGCENDKTGPNNVQL